MLAPHTNIILLMREMCIVDLRCLLRVSSLLLLTAIVAADRRIPALLRVELLTLLRENESESAVLTYKILIHDHLRESLRFFSTAPARRATTEFISSGAFPSTDPCPAFRPNSFARVRSSHRHESDVPEMRGL